MVGVGVGVGAGCGNCGEIKTLSSSIWFIKMGIYHDRFINLCTEIPLAVQLGFILKQSHKLKYKVVVRTTNLYKSKTSSSYQDTPRFQFSNCRLKVCWKNIAVYICHLFSGAVVFEPSALCEMWSIWHAICSAFVDSDLSIHIFFLDCLAAASKIKDHFIY